MSSHDECKRLADLDRRDVLKLTGASASLIGLAGCGGDGGGEATETATETETETEMDGATETATEMGTDLSDDALTSGLVFMLVEEMNWNPFSTNYPFFGRHMVHPPLALWHRFNGKIGGVQMKDWSIDGSTFTIKVHANDITWSNDTPFLAKDLETKLKLEGFTDRLPEQIQADTIQATSEDTVEMELVSSNLNQRIFRNEIFSAGGHYPRRTSTHRDQFGEWIEKFSDATTDDERKSVQGDLTEFKIDEPLSCGPFTFNTSESETKLAVFDRRDDYPLDVIRKNASEQTDYDFSGWPDQFNFPKLELLHYEGRRLQLMLQDKLDVNVGGPGMDEEFLDKVPDHMQVFGTKSPNGFALVFNHEAKWFRRPKFRKALLMVLPRNQLGKSDRGILFSPAGLQTGMAPDMEQRVLPEDFRNELTRYPAADTDQAESLLREMDWTKKNGQWHDEDGELVEFSYKGPAESGSLITSATQILKQFGFAAETQTTERTGWHEQIRTGDYTLSYGFWGGGPHPYNAMQNYFVPPETDDFHSYPTEVTVPAMPGDSGEMTVNVEEMTQAIAQSPNREENIERIKTLAWVFNQDLPTGMLWTGTAGQFNTWDHWRFPVPNEDPWNSTSFAWWYAFQFGLIQGKPEGSPTTVPGE